MRTKCRLACKADGHVTWLQSLTEFPPVSFGISFVPRQNLLLRRDAGFHYLLRLIPSRVRRFFPFQARFVTAVCPPAETAVHVTVVNCRRHLNASVGFYAVKLLF